MKSAAKLPRHFSKSLLLASLIFLCALIGTTSISQAAPQENLPAPIFTRNVSFGIPYTIPPARSATDQPVEVRLFVATRDAKSWQIADAKKLESTAQGVRGQFVYQAPNDGEFWFAIRTVDRQGQLRGGKNGPELRVIVDTQPPTIRLNAERNASGAITLRWEIADALLLPDSLVVSYQVAGKPDWRTVAIDRSRAAGTAKPIVGTATFWPDAATGDLQIRAEVRDRAGNNGMNQVRVEGKAGALASSIPTTSSNAAAPTNPSLRSRSSSTEHSSASNSNAISANDPPPQFPFANPTPNNTSTPSNQPTADPFGRPAVNTSVSPPLESSTAQSVLRPTTEAAGQGNAIAPPPAQPLNGMRLAPADEGPNLFAPLNSSPTDSGVPLNGASSSTETLNSANQNQNIGPNSSTNPNSAAQNAGLPANELLPPAGSASGIGYHPGRSALSQQELSSDRTTSFPSQQPVTQPPSSVPSASDPQNSPLAPRVESRVVASNPQPSAAGTTESQLTKIVDYRLANGKLPTMVNSRTFEWEYEIAQMPSSGIASVELWITQDAGKTWQTAGIDDDKRSPIRTQVPGEGVYGYRITVQGNGASKPRPPQSGEQPEMWIGVDLTRPNAKLLNAELTATGNTTGDIGITWNASDTLLASKPIRLLYSDKPNGQWKPIAEALDNSGRYTWHYDEKTPDRVYIRLEVTDIAGNVGTSESLEPIELGRYQAEGKLRGVKPIGESSSLIVPLNRKINALSRSPRAISSSTAQSIHDSRREVVEIPSANQLSNPTEVIFENGNVKMIGNPYLTKNDGGTVR